ncbi:MAG: glycosyltransferase [Phycisphaerales bacterium]|nr:MAG: glycosyltransferase [Phycisphaerales bacterium]
MRVAVLLSSFPSLSETFILGQVTGLIDRGHSVDLYPGLPGKTTPIHPDVDSYGLLARSHYPVTVPSGRLHRYLRAARVLIGHAYKNPAACVRALNPAKYGHGSRSLNVLFGMVPFLPERSYDVIHCHFGPNGLRGMVLRNMGVLHGKLITTFHGFDVNSWPREHGRAVYQALFETGDCYTVNSRFTASRAVALGCPEPKIARLPVGVDTRKFVPRKTPRPSGGPVRILTVGNLVPHKGIDYSIRAMAKVCAEFPNIRYDIVGDGPLQTELAELARELNLENVVRFLGPRAQDELPGIYAEADLFVLASVVGKDGAEEGQGLVFAEAQAAGLPVTGTRIGGIPEAVLDGESGFLVPQRDVDALAEKLLDLVRHPHLWPEMGRAGRTFVEKHYDSHKLNDRLVEIYEQLLT